MDFVPFKCLSFNHLGHSGFEYKSLLLGLDTFVGSE